MLKSPVVKGTANFIPSDDLSAVDNINAPVRDQVTIANYVVLYGLIWAKDIQVALDW